MTSLDSAWNHVKIFDDLAARKTVVHRLHPGVKLLTTLVFIVMTASFHKYDLTALLPFFLYPVVLISLAELPAGYFLKTLLFAIPFVVFVGIFNPLFDRTPLLQIGAVSISGGWLSFISILVRVALTVLAVLILIATSGMYEIAAMLLSMKIPRIFVVQLLFLYRYLSVLMEETSRTLRAYSLRASHEKGLAFKVWGSLAGQLLLRTINRAERIYQAMLCRGFTGEIRLWRPGKLRSGDILYFLGWSGFFVIARLYNIPELLGAFLYQVLF